MNPQPPDTTPAPNQPESEPEISPGDDWLSRYSESHRHPVNQACHMGGIPMVTLSLPLAFVVAIFAPAWWPLPTGLFVVGWLLQFVGHAVEGKPPEFFKDWRFLFVGLRWWFSKLSRS